MATGGESDPLIEDTDDTDDTKEDNDGTFNFDPSKPVETSTPVETFEMQTRLHEQSGLPDTSYQEETNFGGTATDEEIERRLNSLRDSRTGLLDLSKIELQNIVLSDEDKKRSEESKISSKGIITTSNLTL